MNRFDIPAEIREILTVAVQQKVLDVLDVYALASDFGDDYTGLTNEICNIAFSDHHCNPAAHAAVVASAEKYWMSTFKATFSEL